MAIKITVNGEARSTEAASDTPLLYVLRDDLRAARPEVRLRPLAVRRLRGARGRQGDPLLRDADRGRRGQGGDHVGGAAGLVREQKQLGDGRRCIRCSRPGSTSRSRSAATARAG